MEFSPLFALFLLLFWWQLKKKTRLRIFVLVAKRIQRREIYKIEMQLKHSTRRGLNKPKVRNQIKLLYRLYQL